jgi:L-lactate utilization protein LutC
MKELIKKYQRVARRNKQIYHDNLSEKDAWIHSMVCYQLMNTEDDVEWEALQKLISSYETNLIWCYQDGIDENVEELKELLGDRFIPYEEEDDHTETVVTAASEIALFTFTFRSKL